MRRRRDGRPSNATLAAIAAAAYELESELTHPVPDHVMRRVRLTQLTERIRACTPDERGWLRSHAALRSADVDFQR